MGPNRFKKVSQFNQVLLAGVSHLDATLRGPLWPSVVMLCSKTCRHRRRHRMLQMLALERTDRTIMTEWNVTPPAEAGFAPDLARRFDIARDAGNQP